MQEICTYEVEVRDKVEGSTFNMNSPFQIKVLGTERTATRFTFCADQSGLIGLIRYLHGQGFVLLCVHRYEDSSSI